MKNPMDTTKVWVQLLLHSTFFLLPLVAAAATNDLSSALQQGLFEEEANRNLPAAVEAYETVAKQFDQNRALAATAIFRLGEVNRKLGKTNEAAVFYQRILSEFSDQETLAKLSQQNLAGMGFARTKQDDASQGSERSQPGTVAQIVDLQVKIALEEEQLASLKKLSEDELLRVLPTVSGDPTLKDIGSQLSLAQQALLKTARDFSRDHPAYKTAEALVDELTQKRADCAAAVLKGMEMQLNARKAALAKLNSQNLAGNVGANFGVVDPQAALSPEAEELARTQKLSAQLRGWDLPQLRRLIPTLIPDAEFERLDDLLSVNERFGDSASDEILEQRHVLEARLAARADEIRSGLAQRAAELSKITTEKAKTLQAAERSLPRASNPPVNDEEEVEIRRIQAMIQNSPDLVNAPSGENGTPLYQAASKGQLRVAAFLLDHGADVNARSGAAGKIYVDWTPLFVAASRGHKAMVELLAARGADVSATVRTMTGREGGNLNGGTALHQAVIKGFQAVAESLLASKADINARDADGRTPLHFAAASGQVGLTVFLLAKGADVNAVDSHGATALMRAASDGHLETLRKLIDAKASVGAATTDGHTALGYAAVGGHQDCVGALLAAKADPNGGKIDLPLPCAIKSESAGIVGALLEAGADANRLSQITWRVSKPGSMPVPFTSRLRSATGRAPELQSVTPLMLAVNGGGNNVVALLLAHKADPNGSDIDGKPILFAALTDAVMMSALLDAGANPNVDDGSKDQLRPLNLARNPEVIRLLLAAGANAQPACERLTPLQQAVVDGDRDRVNALLAGGAQVDACPWTHYTPLHYAASRLDEGMVLELLAAKADVNARTDSGQTPLDIAIQSGHQSNASRSAYEKVAEILRQQGGLADLPKLDRIEVFRAGGPRTAIFIDDTNHWNRFTILEALGRTYSLSSVSYGSGAGSPVTAFGLPDLERVIIHRPNTTPGGHDREIRVNLLDGTNGIDCSKDAWLEFGDTIEIPIREHPLNEKMVGLTIEQLQGMARCTSKHVRLLVRGQEREFEPYSFWSYLKGFLARSDVQSMVLSSSDLSRVKVTRRESPSGEPKVWILDCSTSSSMPDLWLRDGDVIEVPEK